MAAGHFFLGVTAGVAILVIPAAVVAPQLDLPGRVGAWVAGPAQETKQAPGSDLPGVSRPQRGYMPGQLTPTPDAPPTLKPVDRPTPQPTHPTPQPTPPPGALLTSGPAAAPVAMLQTGVVRSGGTGVYVRRVAGVQSPADAFLAEGSPVLVAAGSEVQVSGQTWRAVRGLNGAAGWVPSNMVSVDGPGGPGGAAARAASSSAGSSPGRALVAHTDGTGVVLRGSPRADDRLPAGLREGTAVSVLERFGSEWARVRADNGLEGWVPTQYLSADG